MQSWYILAIPGVLTAIFGYGMYVIFRKEEQKANYNQSDAEKVTAMFVGSLILLAGAVLYVLMHYYGMFLVIMMVLGSSTGAATARWLFYKHKRWQDQNIYS